MQRSRAEYFKNYHKEKGPIYLSRRLLEQIAVEAEKAGIKSREFVPLMLQKWRENPITLPTFANIFGINAPSIITGVPRSGKTYSVKKVLKQSPDPMLVIDPEGEYEFLERINESQIYNIDWSARKQIRYMPTVGVNPRDTVKSILERAMLEKEKLKQWAFVIDEAQLFSDLRIFKRFVARAPKWTRKIIVITADYKEFEGLGEIIRVPAYS